LLLLTSRMHSQTKYHQLTHPCNISKLFFTIWLSVVSTFCHCSKILTDSWLYWRALQQDAGVGIRDLCINTEEAMTNVKNLYTELSSLRRRLEKVQRFCYIFLTWNVHMYGPYLHYYWWMTCFGTFESSVDIYMIMNQLIDCSIVCFSCPVRSE